MNEEDYEVDETGKKKVHKVNSIMSKCIDVLLKKIYFCFFIISYVFPLKIL